MRFRRQLPAYSPVSGRTVWAGVAGMLRQPGSVRERIEQSLKESHAARSVLLVGSGTTALRLALAGIRGTVSRGSIALPAYSCHDMATAADGADASVVLYDVEPTTLGPEKSSLRRALERAPAALVGAHLYGYPVDMDHLAELCRDAGTVLIEDAAQGAGARLRGRELGSFGSLSVLSFGRGKGISAGAGGALLAHDETGERIVSWAKAQLTRSAAGARQAALLAAQWVLGRPDRYWLPAALPFLHLGETVYHVPAPATVMSRAAIHALHVSLGAHAFELDRRRAAAERLLERARRSDKVDVIEPVTGAAPGYLRLPLLANGVARSEALRTLDSHGAAAAYPAGLASLRPFRERVLNPAEELSGARILVETLLTFPTHGLLGAADLSALEGWLDTAPQRVPSGALVSREKPAELRR